MKFLVNQSTGERKKKVADLLAWWRISRLLLFDPMQGQTMRARDNNSMDSSKREMIFLQQKKIELIQRSTLQLKSMEVRSICWYPAYSCSGQPELTAARRVQTGVSEGIVKWHLQLGLLFVLGTFTFSCFLISLCPSFMNLDQQLGENNPTILFCYRSIIVHRVEK